VQADWNANGYRLPTEAEWEYACRAGTSTDYNGYTWNDDWGWYRDNSSAITHEVGKKLPNDWDLYDMRGNVEEWVWDWYDSDADTAPSIPLHQRTLAGGSYTSTVMDPFGPDSGSGRVFRGGSCQSSAEDLVSVYGSDNSPNDRIDFLGFRLARNGSTDYSEEPKALPKEEIKARERSENANGISIPGDTGSASDVSRESVISGRASARGIGIASHVMTPIDAGIFQMGSPAAKANWNKDKRHSVTLPRGFYIGTYPVTQELYQRVMGSNPSRFKSSPANGEAQARRPVEQVSWYDAIVFCNKLSILVGLSPVYRIQGSTDPSSWGAVPGSSNAEWDAVQADWNANGYRLPTEAEWEYACRAGKQIVDDTSDNTGWFSGNSDNRTHEVGKKLPNAWGLYDMHGNVYEWCWDWYGDDYYTAAGAGSDPKGPASGEFRVERGGSWTNGEVNMRSASRSRFYPNRRYYTLGFRVVCNNPSSRLRRVLNNP
jgi:formylglycine-generating enzyme required for sulfatase activity